MSSIREWGKLQNLCFVSKFSLSLCSSHSAAEIPAMPFQQQSENCICQVKSDHKKEDRRSTSIFSAPLRKTYCRFLFFQQKTKFRDCSRNTCPKARCARIPTGGWDFLAEKQTPSLPRLSARESPSPAWFVRLFAVPLEKLCRYFRWERKQVPTFAHCLSHWRVCANVDLGPV